MRVSVVLLQGDRHEYEADPQAGQVRHEDEVRREVRLHGEEGREVREAAEARREEDRPEGQGKEGKCEMTLDISKIKLVLVALTGGVSGILSYLLGLFNTQVLGKIKDKEEAQAYLKDTRAASTFVGAILENHASSFSDKTKESVTNVRAALELLATSLEDLNLTQDELDDVIDRVKTAIKSFKS